MADSGFLKSSSSTLRLIPKRETGAEAFLTKFPEYDGRGITIGIFDTGVDPGAPGLQHTSHGSRKMLDCIDCTGSGDVDTSHTVTTIPTPCDEAVEIQGVSGRLLQLCNQWTNPSGKWFVGVKLLAQLFPDKVKNNVQNHEKHEFEVLQNQAVAKALLELCNFNAAHPAPSQKEKEEQNELQARIDVLNALGKNATMPSEAADVIAFNDGENWRVALSVGSDGDMTCSEALLPFRLSGKYSTFAGRSKLNYTVDVFDEGSTVSIVTTSGAHGTHVAGIAAGYHEDNPEFNGVAPGAQIVSMKIGDARLKTMETGVSLVRAALAAVKYKCDVVNLSYGEASLSNNNGYVVDTLADLTRKYGIVFIASAGNHGPCLSTLGCPGGTTSQIISVGAYVSPEMMQTQYSLIDQQPGLNFTWSSCGPTTDGHLGVDISAPGGAISPVPTWTLRSKQLMNGTSMSSPNACGCVALLLSGLKEEGIPYSPFSVRRAVINTAYDISQSERLVLGYGLIQVEPAFNWLRRHNDMPKRGMYFDVTVGSSLDSSPRGVYLRDHCASLCQPARFLAFVTPKTPRDHADHSDIQLALSLELSVVATKPWVSVASHLSLAYASRSFELTVDTRGLEHGVHYAEVQAFCSEDKDHGPLFRVPVVVIIPKELPKSSYELTEKITFSSSHPQRRFIRVPESATYADLTLTGCCDRPAQYTVHAVQLEPQASFGKHEFVKGIKISKDEKSQQQFSVMGGLVLDLTIARAWNQNYPLEVTMTLKFNSLKSIGDGFDLHANKGFGKLLIHNGLGPCSLQPQCIGTHSVTTFLPSERKSVAPLGERDTFIDGCTHYQMQLFYKLAMVKTTECSFEFRYLSSVLYESEYHSQMWMIFDSNKRFVAAGDAFPSSYIVKLEKGEYLLRLQVRHHLRKPLEALKDLVLSVVSKLASPVNVDMYGSQLEVMKQGRKFLPKTVQSDSVTPIFLLANTEDKTLKTDRAVILEGKISFSKPLNRSAAKSTAVDGVDWYPFSMTFTAQPLSSKGASASRSSPSSRKSAHSRSKSPAKPGPTLANDNASPASANDSSSSITATEQDDQYQDALMDFNLAWMTKHKDLSRYDELLKAHPGKSLSLLQAYLNVAFSKMTEKSFDQAGAVFFTCNKIISQINVQEVFSASCRKKDPQADSSPTSKKSMEKQVQIYQEALVKKLKALCILLSCESASLPAEHDAEDDHVSGLRRLAEENGVEDCSLSKEDLRREVDETMAAIEMWFDPQDSKIVMTTVTYYGHKGWYGMAANTLLKVMKSSTGPSPIEDEKTLIQLLEQLEYNHLSSNHIRALHTKFPPDYLPF